MQYLTTPFQSQNAVALAGNPTANAFTRGWVPNHWSVPPGAGLLLGLLLWCALPLRAQTFQWAKPLSGNVSQKKVSVDGTGNVYVTGSFEGTATFGFIVITLPDYGFPIQIPVSLTSDGGSDIFVAKYNNTGALVWARRAGGPESDAGSDIVTDASGNVYVTGTYEELAWFRKSANPANQVFLENLIDTRQHAFIVKYNASGTAQWARQGKSTNGTDQGLGIAVERFSGDVLVTGYFNGTLAFGSGGGTVTLAAGGFVDLFVVKYGTGGGFQWARKAGGTNSAHEVRGAAVGVDPYDGYAYVVGSFAGTANFGGGNSLVTSPYISNVFVAKYGPSGTLLWTRQAGQDAVIDEGSDVDVDVAGSVYLTGTFKGKIKFGDEEIATPAGENNLFPDVFIAKYNGAGTAQWAKRVGETFSFSPPRICVGPVGGIFLTGNFLDVATFDNNQPASVGGSDGFIAKYYSTGEVNWVKQVSGSSDQYLTGIGVDYSDNAYVAGSSFSALSLDGISLENAPLGSHAFIAKLGPPPSVNVTNFTLVNADTDLDVGILFNFGTVDYAAIGTTNINIRANTSPAVGSVIFTLLGSPTVTENSPPYAYAGGIADDYNGFSPAPSPSYYRMTATPYSENDGQGVRGTARLLFFKVTDGGGRLASAEPVEAVAELTAQPNPFAGQTTLRFRVGKAGRASLEVYDLKGARVARLFEGAAEAGQLYRCAWDGERLAPGLYLARLASGDGVLTQKMVLTR
ncbi:MAG: SBBP repeat-containing protein [Ferruginibacter sp.]|nr:SBBP repeat-containing protein [Cytophagales bacterium]